jgi:hypothetical protein
MRSTTHSPRGTAPKASHAFHRTLTTLCCCAGLLALATLPAQATTYQQPPKKLQRVEYVGPYQRHPGGETTYERERRLKRECKGRPNAGACSGYTH